MRDAVQIYILLTLLTSTLITDIFQENLG